MSAIQQFKALILTNPLYTAEMRTAAANLLDSMDQDLDIAGPYEPSDVTLELIEKFNDALCEVTDDSPEEEVEEDEDDSDSISREQLLEGVDDSDHKQD